MRIVGMLDGEHLVAVDRVVTCLSKTAAPGSNGFGGMPGPEQRPDVARVAMIRIQRERSFDFLPRTRVVALDRPEHGRQRMDDRLVGIPSGEHFRARRPIGDSHRRDLRAQERDLRVEIAGMRTFLRERRRVVLVRSGVRDQGSRETARMRAMRTQPRAQMIAARA